MADPIPVLIPLINPNEPEAVLAALHVREGQRVSPGDLLCTLETTKSTADLASETGGYVIGLRFEQGQAARAGEVLCHLSESPLPGPGPAPLAGGQAQAGGGEAALPEGLRITRPALALARQHGLDLARLPTGPLVTESLVRSLVEPASSPQAGQKPGAPGSFSAPPAPFDPTAIIVYGGGGHGKIVIDLLQALAVYRLAGIIDDGRPPGEAVMGVPVLGGAELLPRLHGEGVRLAVNAIGGISDIAVRIKIFRRLAEAGFACPAIVHPTAWVERSASLAPGAHVLAHAYLGSESRVGYGAIVSTGVIVSHDCRLGDYANISPGAILAGEVQVGAGALVGMGVTVNLGVKIGAGARLGNGATVLTDVPERGVVRAGTTWPKQGSG
jgi:sugar O-acyltransferase (sialic acid O-acetyltransferase NeuD family)